MGAAIARAPLRTSPILGRRCIGYRLVVEYYDVGAQGSHRAIEEDVFDSFVLAERTGQALLHAPFDIKMKRDNRGDGGDLPPAVLDRLEREGVRTHGIQGETRTFEYFETVLMPGDEIIADGYATFDVDPGGRSSHRDPPVICHLKGTADDRVAIASARDSR
jgi:hypothetical protein